MIQNLGLLIVEHNIEWVKLINNQHEIGKTFFLSNVWNI